MLTRNTFPAIIGGILLLAACGGGSDSGSTGPQPVTPGGNGVQQVGAEVFGMTEEQLVTRIEKVEARIASCMSQPGFEYLPIDPVTFLEAKDALGTVPGLSDEEFVVQYGYGLTTLPPRQAFGTGEENAAIFNDLTPTDQAAYTRALVGEDADATFLIMLDDEVFEAAGGCTRTAVEEAFSPEQLSAIFVNPFDAQVEADQRMVDALKAWSRCVKDAGYDYETSDDLEGELTDRLDAITGGADPATLTGGDKNALTELQNDERALAQVDLACTEQEVRAIQEQVERDITGRD